MPRTENPDDNATPRQHHAEDQPAETTPRTSRGNRRRLNPPPSSRPLPEGGAALTASRSGAAGQRDGSTSLRNTNAHTKRKTRWPAVACNAWLHDDRPRPKAHEPTRAALQKLETRPLRSHAAELPPPRRAKTTLPDAAQKAPRGRRVTVAISRKPQRQPFKKLRKHQRWSNAETVKRFVGCIAVLCSTSRTTRQLLRQVLTAMRYSQYINFGFLLFSDHQVHNAVAFHD